MTQKTMQAHDLKINRAPVLTLWATVVAERLGFAHDEALSLGRAVAGLNAYAKGVALGVFTPTPDEVKRQRQQRQAAERMTVELLQRAVPAQQTVAGLRALSKNWPIHPESVQRYFQSTCGETLEDVYHAMGQLAESRSPARLAAEAYHLYEQFRPQGPAGAKGWGAVGLLRRETLRMLAEAATGEAGRRL